MRRFSGRAQRIPRHRTEGWELTLNGYEVVLHGEWCEHLIDDGPDGSRSCSPTVTRSVSRARHRFHIFPEPCDPATDLLCQTTCTNNMRVTCLCAGGNNAQWTCTQPMDCQP